MFYNFGSWLLRLDEVDVVMVKALPNGEYSMIAHMKNGTEYTLRCKTWGEYERQRNAISLAMNQLHREPVTRYEVENIVRREVQKARGDIRTLKNILLEGLEGLRREKEDS